MHILKIPNLDNVYSSFEPYFKIAFVAGSKNIETTIKDAYSKSKIRILITLLLLSSGVGLAFYGNSSNVENTKLSKIYTFCFWVYYGGVYSRSILIYILNFWDASKEIELFKAVDDFDRTLKTLGKSKELRKGHKRCFAKAILVVILALITNITTETFVCLMSYEHVSVATVICHLMAIFVGEFSKCYFFLWTLVITDRFTMINDFMTKIKKRSKLKGISVVGVHKFERDFSQIIDMHKDLTAIARLMNDIFQVQMIWHFAISFIVGFTNAYFCIYTVAHEVEYGSSFWLTVVKFYIFVTFDFAVLMNSSYELCAQAARTKEITSYIKLEVQDDISHRLVIASIYELRENKLVITACRLFDIDYSTMFVMGTTITNYVFIMLQFEGDSPNSKGNSTAVNVSTMSTMLAASASR